MKIKEWFDWKVKMWKFKREIRILNKLGYVWILG